MGQLPAALRLPAERRGPGTPQAIWAEIAVYQNGQTGWPARVLDPGAGRV
jgi:hypothetical protein